MSTANEQNPDAGFQPNARPQSTIALDFSAALDDLFKLNGIGALEESVEQKKETVTSRKYELEDLETRLREADNKLKHLKAKHQRQQSQQVFTKRKPVTSPTSPEPEEDSSGDSDQARSPQQYRGVENR
ncbi:hypothetical protein A1O7_09755 [Cladophialophora yegresii CBS 114405]|uniref:Uncharacterized protein n=1 Tax=Cladophialophora yegresii CBS 114405 TaxID=1182544 RepID=W9VQK9_9EURO|nr:uncharacterized protein A1O7_09755 [Cladophialophora yegresii CBS 114405]EXJ54416.1 hypothetical protein A1O7_09755 [Cladophialophora yegresii CBS 114405]